VILLVFDVCLHEILDVMTENRILFASDSPWSDQSAAVRWIKNLPLPEEEQALILGKNAKKLLAL
jgi:predicted TIM-barrel fold metal-dependent hydrolase